MGSLRLDRLLDFLISYEMFLVLLWLGLAALTIALLVLMRTRWGQSHALRKCLVLSLLAHLLLAGYATTVQIVGTLPVMSGEPVIHVAVAEDASPQEKDSPRQPVENREPWDALKHDAVSQPDPVNLDRAEVGPIPRPKRRLRGERTSLINDPMLEHLPLAEAVRPDPERPPADAVGPGPSAGKLAEKIQAPAAQRREDKQTLVPVRAAPKRLASTIQSTQPPARTSDAGVPVSLLERPVPLPRMASVPRTPDPAAALAALTDSGARPSRGKPAESATQNSPRTGLGAGTPSGGGGSDATPQAERLWRPSIASLGGNHYPSGSTIDTPSGTQASAGRPPVPLHRRDGGKRRLPSIYRLRTAPDRSRQAQRRGATPETEAAVKAALKWLADNQEQDGRWDAQKFDAGREEMVSGRNRLNAGARADTGMTGLALLAFLAAGHTNQRGSYQSNVRRGIEYLVTIQGRDGNLAGQATTYAAMYCHAMATFALSEAYAMTGQEELELPVKRAVVYIVASQNPSGGGWRYQPRDEGDTSQLGWQLMALKSAELAGIPTPQATRYGAIRFLNSVSSGTHRGLASYRPTEPASRPMTAEALVCRQFLGMDRESPTAREAGDYLLGELPGKGKANLYYWYYATLGMYQLQGTHWERWNKALQTNLLASQRKTGSLAGSWDPDTVWGC